MGKGGTGLEPQRGTQISTPISRKRINNIYFGIHVIHFFAST